MRKLILISVAASLILGVIAFIVSSGILSNKSTPEIKELTVWGFLDDEGVFRDNLDQYQKLTGIKVIYVKQTSLNYRPRLLAQLQAGKGPDIFLMDSSWVPQIKEELSNPPANVVRISDFKALFYPVAIDNLVIGDRIYGLPMELNGLALFYNENILKAANVLVPKTWVEFVDGARRVTVRDSSGAIQTSGAALGTTTNVDLWPEILSLLIFEQPNGDPKNPGNKDGAEVASFFTSFVTDPKNKTWDTTLPNSLDQFAAEKLAFYFGDINKIHLLKQKNPNLNFKVAPVPQLPGKNVSFGEFLAWGVSKRSVGQIEAWKFLAYLSSAQSLQQLNSKRAEASLGTRVYPRVDMAGVQSKDPILGAFVTQGPQYKSWYLSSNYPDGGGLNDEMIRLYQEALRKISQGTSPEGALSSITPGIQDLLVKYGLK